MPEDLSVDVTFDVYRTLAARLDALPNGFPSTTGGAELRLLARLYTPAEAALAATLRLTLEAPAAIAARSRLDEKETAALLKSMARRGLIAAGRTASGLCYGLMPFVVGIYEMQGDRIDAETARLFEEYYPALGRAMATEPAIHRVVVNQSLNTAIEVHPYESAAGLLAEQRAWGVTGCICRKQKALLGQPCEHPIELCMVLSPTEGAFDHAPGVRALTYDQALDTLRQAAELGLVHTVKNQRDGGHYICNCCTCSCGVLRGMAELGLANVVARSAFVNRVDEEKCRACGVCVDRCSFAALALDGVVRLDAGRCAGCGVCVGSCPEGALALVRRPAADVLPPPSGESEWQTQRAAARGLDLGQVL